MTDLELLVRKAFAAGMLEATEGYVDVAEFPGLPEDAELCIAGKFRTQRLEEILRLLSPEIVVPRIVKPRASKVDPAYLSIRGKVLRRCQKLGVEFKICSTGFELWSPKGFVFPRNHGHCFVLPWKQTGTTAISGYLGLLGVLAEAFERCKEKGCELCEERRPS